MHLNRRRGAKDGSIAQCVLPHILLPHMINVPMVIYSKLQHSNILVSVSVRKTLLEKLQFKLVEVFLTTTHCKMIAKSYFACGCCIFEN